MQRAGVRPGASAAPRRAAGPAAAAARPAPRAAAAGPSRRRAARVVASAAGTRSGSVSGMSAQMREVRSRMEKDEQLGALMAGFRGSNLSDADFAESDTAMRFVEASGDAEGLPQVYDPAAISAYWGVRPVSVVRRIVQLMSIAGSFLSGLAIDVATDKVKANEVTRAIQLREIVTSLGPAYIKLGQALSIRPDLLSPAAMAELQKLCDKVPSFDSAIAMQVINDELGAPWYEVFAELTLEPIAAASLGQVYKGRLKTGELVAVKVQRPGVLETVTIDLYIIRRFGNFLKRFPALTTDVVALLDEWAARFFEELDYVREGENATRFAAQMEKDLPQARGADDVGTLVNVGVICYLKQLLDTGFFHAVHNPKWRASHPLEDCLVPAWTGHGRWLLLDLTAQKSDWGPAMGGEGVVTTSTLPDVTALFSDVADARESAREDRADAAGAGGDGAEEALREELADRVAKGLSRTATDPHEVARLRMEVGVGVGGGGLEGDPHPGNLIRTPDGRLAILDFGLMTEVDDGIKYGMIEAISHLIHRDYDAIVLDFVTLQFIPEGTDLRPILPVLAKVFDAALEGGGAKNINFQELAADLAQITFDYPFRIPPYFALIIRAIGVLEGIALVGDPDFAIVDEAYPYIAKRLLTDSSPRLQDALRYMVYGKEKVFDADRLIDLLNAFESFTVAANSARGEMDGVAASGGGGGPGQQQQQQRAGVAGGGGAGAPWGVPGPFGGLFPSPLGAPLAALLGGGGDGAAAPAAAWPFGGPAQQQQQQQRRAAPGGGGIGLFGLPANRFDLRQGSGALDSQGRLREALRFVFSSEGALFRAFIMEELVKSVDALSREQLALLVARVGLSAARVPVLLPGAAVGSLPLAPTVSEEDRRVVENLAKIVDFLAKGGAGGAANAANGNGGGAAGALSGAAAGADLAAELLPYLPAVAREVLPELARQLLGRISARLVRELFVTAPAAAPAAVSAR
ncbi:hypothetical protein Rsub_11900 [Raphidocelis subcapitata]|uniref:Uncharacterized protein n=1 Tax=Raphidocelis subcapitata TaxID=307507 RepID=A0A2V0PGZ1_9CHLO|nr:hypothetical protein Rsub_11900 [Raphidocelis subcapitata]|eukprot:GBF99091.1 hypothetical protein Rsub_11900 [Raphidocelis subcapitata]